MRLVAIGVVVGVIASQFAARLLTTVLFGVSTRDLWTYAAVAAVGLAE